MSFTVKLKIPPANLQKALNTILPGDVRVSSLKLVVSSFNARFDAKSKTYEYYIYNGKILSPHLRKIAWQIKPELNLAAMKKAAKYLVGEHDFSSFCAARGDDIDKVRTISQFVVCHSSLLILGGTKVPLIRIKVSGNGFLYKMVRNLVGTLVDIGIGKIKPEAALEILKAKQRRAAGRTAPAQGLCLVRVNY